MPDTWITDITDYVDEQGASVPRRGKNKSMSFS
jgi:hypothetical protein